MRLCLLLAGLNVAVAYQKLDYGDDGVTCQDAIDCRDCCEQLCWLMADSEPCHMYLVPQCTKQCEKRASSFHISIHKTSKKSSSCRRKSATVMAITLILGVLV